MASGLDNNSTQLTTEMPNCTDVIHPYENTSFQINIYLNIVSYILGIPGNILAFLVWIRPGMRHSSGVYMALLALTQIMVLVCNIILYMNQWWEVILLDYPVICQLYTVLYYCVQYLDPLLYLAFTVERYISVCHPFQRRQLCTTTRAMYVSMSLVCLSLATSSVNGYFWHYDDGHGCSVRDEVIVSTPVSIWNIWSYVTESVYFLLVPITVLVLNIFVIHAVNKSRNRFNTQVTSNNNSSGHDKTAANSKMLLYVSFYFIICVLPVSIMYVFQTVLPLGDPCVDPTEDATWNAFYTYDIVRTIVESISLLHYALNFYMYMVIGKVFRKEFCKMMLCCRSRYHASVHT